jgi:hypothetical protein
MSYCCTLALGHPLLRWHIVSDAGYFWMMLVEIEDRKSETALGMLNHNSRALLFNILN